MSVAVVALFGLVGVVMVGIIRWVSTAKTDQSGFTELASFYDATTAVRARAVLKRAGIPVALDDHHGSAWGAIRGITRVLVAEDHLSAAREVLLHEASYVEPKEPHTLVLLQINARVAQSWAWQRWGVFTGSTGFALLVADISILESAPQTLRATTFGLSIALMVFGLVWVALGLWRDRADT